MSSKTFYSKIPSPLITREHGSWAVLIIPMLVSLAVAVRWRFDFVWMVVTALAVFLIYVPAQVLLRHYFGMAQRIEKVHQAKVWGFVYGIISLVCAGVLVMKGYVLLIPIGGAGVLIFIVTFYLTKKYLKSIWTDLIAIGGLTLSGPSAYYVLAGGIDTKAATLYVLTLLFFGCSVFYVHMKIGAAAVRRRKMFLAEKIAVGKMNLVYLAVVVAIVGSMAILGFVPPVVIAAFIPMIVQGIYGTVMLSANVRFKSLGLILLGQSVVFASILSQTMS